MSEHDQPNAPNLLARNFQPAMRNQSWASDTTELVTGSGELYLATVLDLYSRFVVGWAVSAVNDPLAARSSRAASSKSAQAFAGAEEMAPQSQRV